MVVRKKWYNLSLRRIFHAKKDELENFEIVFWKWILNSNDFYLYEILDCYNLESPLPERVPGAPQVQENWTSIGPSGQQVECLLRVIAQVKNKGVTGDHVVFSFVSRRIQPLQHRQHPSFRYEGIEDATRMLPEPMAHYDVIRRCCKVLDNFDKSLKLPTLFWAKNPPENAWVSVEKHRRVLVIKVFIFWWTLASFAEKL